MCLRTQLTDRQWKIAELVVTGDRNVDIGGVFSTTEDTIKNEFRQIFDVAGVWNRTQLAVAVVRHEFECKICNVAEKTNEEICRPSLSVV